ARVIYQNMNLPPLGHDLTHRALDILFVPDIHLHRENEETERPKLRGCGVQMRVIAGCYGDAGPIFGQLQANGFADSGSPAGNECYTTFDHHSKVILRNLCISSGFLAKSHE